MIGRRTSLSNVAGPRFMLGQEQVVRLPFVPEPGLPDRSGDTPLAAREKAHDALARVRTYASGIAKHADILARYLGPEKASLILAEAALSIDRAEEEYLAAEAALNRERIARSSATMTR